MRGRIPCAIALMLAAHCGTFGSDEDAAKPPSPSADAAPEMESSVALPADAGSDAPSTFCSSRGAAVFCADFDGEGATVDELEPDVSPLVPAPALTRRTAQSLPRSLYMSLPAGLEPAIHNVFARTVTGDGIVRLELDWNATELGVGGTLQSLTIKRGGPQFAFGRTCGPDLDGGTACTWEIFHCGHAAACTSVVVIADPKFTRAWARVFFEARMTKTGHIAMGFVGEEPLVDHDIDAIGTAPLENVTTVTVGLGLHQGTSPGFGMYFDDIVIETR